MKSFKGKLVLVAFVALVLVAIGGYVSFKYYDYVFAKTVVGEIIGVERVNTNETIITNGSAIPASQIFSFAVAVKDSKGEIHTASSEDRQWAVVQKGQCAEATFYPYPPWDLTKSHTFHGARLIRLFDCPQATPAQEARKAEVPKAEVPKAEAPRVEAKPQAAPIPPRRPGPSK